MARAARILLVDDEVSIQRAVGPLLRARGYDVDVVGTGADALKALRAESPDLIVLDLGLPDIEGTEVARRIRGGSAVPIVVLSARGSEADKVAALDLGADDYVTKPFGARRYTNPCDRGAADALRVVARRAVRAGTDVRSTDQAVVRRRESANRRPALCVSAVNRRHAASPRWGSCHHCRTRRSLVADSRAKARRPSERPRTSRHVQRTG
jgi:CheY-like chemotaxis protein